MQGPAASEQRALAWSTMHRAQIADESRVSDLERAQVWFVRLGAFLLPLVVLWSTNDHVVLPKLLAARVLIFGLALVLARWLRGEMKLRRTPLDLPILAFVASAALSTLFAADLNLAFFGSYGRLEGFSPSPRMRRCSG